MKGTRGITSTKELLSIGTLWRETIIHPHPQLLVFGLRREGEVMKKNIPLRGNLGGMISLMLNHIMRWTIFVIMKLNHFMILISSEMAITIWITIEIMDLTELLGLEDVIVMIMLMMIMIIGLGFLIRTERIVMKETMTMEDIVMILIMIGGVGEMAIGGGVNLVIESGIKDV